MTLRGAGNTTRLESTGDLYPGSDGALQLLERGEGALAGLLTDSISDGLLAELYAALLLQAREIGDAAWGADAPGQALIDPQVCPPYALPYAAQASLSALPPRYEGETEAAWIARSRALLTATTRVWRGTEGAVRAAAQQHLSGTKAVRVVMLPPDDWAIEVRVRDTEVVHLGKLTAAVNDPAILRAGMAATVTQVTAGAPWSIGEMEDIYAARTIADLEAAFATLSDLETNPGGV